MSRTADCLIEVGHGQNDAALTANRAGTKTDYRRLAHLITLWNERFRQRRELRELADDPELLKDTGLSSYDVLREARKPFWRE